MTQALSVINTLHSKGWRAMPAQGGWQLSRRPEEGVVRMSLTSSGWLCLTLPLHDDFSITALLSEGERGYRVLLERNVEMFLAKFALDWNLTPLLLAEVGLKDTDPLLASWAIESLAQYKTQQRMETVAEIEWAMARPLTPQYDILSTVSIKLKSARPRLPDVVGGVADETVKLFLDAIQHAGWRVKKKLEGFSWHLLYRGYHRIFDVYLSSSRTWMYFQVPILLDRVASVLNIPEGSLDAQQLRVFFLKYLLRLNQNWFLARVGMSSDNQVLLLVELPTSLLNFALFRQATRTIELYLDRFEQEIQIMASIQHNPRLFTLLRTANY